MHCKSYDASDECDYEDWHGRANRREYWLKTLLLLAVYVLVFFVLLVLLATASVKAESTATHNVLVGVVVVALFFAPGLYWLCDAARRRLHDIGLSGWWVALYVIISVVVRNIVRNCPGTYDALGYIWEVVGDAAPIVIGCLPGTPKKNKYGSVPPRKSFLLWPWRKSSKAMDGQQDAEERDLDE